MTNAKAQDSAQLRVTIHHILVLLLIVLRPSVWDGESGRWPSLIWHGLLAVACVLLGIEWLARKRSELLWSPTAGMAAIVLLALAPAAFRGPDGFDAWALWGQWAGHLILAGYLAQVIRGRERLVIAALVASCTVQVLYALGQWAWSLPYYAVQANEAANGIGMNRGDFLERIHNGGIFGSFTVSNGLAAFLILLAPLITWLATQRLRSRSGIVLGILTLLTAVVVWGTNSKGAIAALAGAGLLTVLLHGTRRWQIAAGAFGLAGLIALCGVPILRNVVAASADVRWGYWQAAAALIEEKPFAGWGIGGFGAQAARVLPLGAEYSRHVHNEVLDAAVMGGLMAGIAVAWWMLLIVRRSLPLQTSDGIADPSDGNELRARLVILPLLFALPYVHVYGVLGAEGWPGAFGGLAPISVLIIAGLAGIAGIATLRLPLPPPWVLRFGLFATLGHALIDFDFHAGGVVGPVVVFAVLAGSPRLRSTTIRWQRPIPMLAGVGLFIAVIFSASRGQAIISAMEEVAEVEALPQVAKEDPDRFYQLLAYRHQALGLPPPSGSSWSAKQFAELHLLAINQAWTVLAEVPKGTPQVRSTLLQRLQPGALRIERSRAFLIDAPSMARAHRLLAEDLEQTGDLREAVNQAQQAVTCAPWHLPHRLALAELCDRAATLLADPSLRDIAKQERDTIAELADRVHVRDRLNEGSEDRR